MADRSFKRAQAPQVTVADRYEETVAVGENEEKPRDQKSRAEWLGWSIPQ